MLYGCAVGTREFRKTRFMSVVRLKNGMTNGAASPRQCAGIRFAGKNCHLLGSIATELELQTSNFVTNPRDEDGTILCFIVMLP